METIAASMQEFISLIDVKCLTVDSLLLINNWKFYLKEVMKWKDLMTKVKSSLSRNIELTSTSSIQGCKCSPFNTMDPIRKKSDL
jgi:hypothetical protein